MHKKTKVTFILNDIESNGGVATVVRDLILALGYIDESKDFLCIVHERKKVEADLDCRVLSITNNWVRAFLACIKSDVLIINLFPYMYLCAILFPFKKKIFIEHNTYNRRRSFKWARLIEKYIYNRYDVVVSISNAVSDSLFNWVGIKSTVVHNGVDLTKFSSINYKSIANIDLWTKCQSLMKLVMVGSFTDQKNQELLIRLAASRSDIQIDFYGIGPNLDRCEQLSIQLGVSNRVIFHGIKKSLCDELPNYDIMVHSVYWEGFGLAVLEGMAAGLPVIASDVPGLSEVSSPEWVFAPDDLDQLNDRLNCINIESYSELQSYGYNVSERFNIQSSALKYNELIDATAK